MCLQTKNPEAQFWNKNICLFIRTVVSSDSGYRVREQNTILGYDTYPMVEHRFIKAQLS